jgi:hypothetical protein
MNIKTSIVIFLLLAATRFIPHPPNFTSLLALSFYVPIIFGIKFIPILILSFAVTDLFIGFHNTIFFTWGSIILIGFASSFFSSNIITRISGALLGACLFFLITNFGIWSLGQYGYSLEGFILCYTLAIPFFMYNLISTLFFSVIFESIYKLNIKRIFKSN